MGAPRGDGASGGRPLHVVVLAAGLGSRLGAEGPKTLTRLTDGRTILQRQLDAVAATLPGAVPHAVVGHRAELVAAAAPGLDLVPAPRYATTNTSKSLLVALDAVGEGDVLWLNGDVVLEPAVLARVADELAARRCSVAVDTAEVGDEEVKYRRGAEGALVELSKQVTRPEGEAVGVNAVTAEARGLLREALDAVADDDYFERAVEVTIERGQVAWWPVDVTGLLAVEVDFPEDLARADDLVAREVTARD